MLIASERFTGFLNLCYGDSCGSQAQFLTPGSEEDKCRQAQNIILQGNLFLSPDVYRIKGNAFLLDHGFNTRT